MARAKKDTTTVAAIGATATAPTPELTPEQKRKNHIWKSQMRSLIVEAHNNGNRKAIDGKMVAASDVDNQVFLTWQSDLQKLHTVVFNYVEKKKNQDVDDSITDADVRAARELIFPKWKEVLRYGDSTPKELHVKEGDVEDLYKFAWEFFNVNEKGTQEASTSFASFRRDVEAFIGCRIAGNKVMTLQDKEVVDKYQKAQKTIASSLDTQAELMGKIAEYEKKIAETESLPEVQKYFVGLKVEAEKELAEAKTRQQEAEATRKKYQEQAQAISDKIKKAELEPIAE